MLGVLAGVIVFALIVSDSHSCLFASIGGVVAFMATSFVVMSVGWGGIVLGILGVMLVWWLFSHL